MPVLFPSLYCGLTGKVLAVEKFLYSVTLLATGSTICISSQPRQMNNFIEADGKCLFKSVSALSGPRRGLGSGAATCGWQPKSLSVNGTEEALFVWRNGMAQTFGLHVKVKP